MSILAVTVLEPDLLNEEIFSEERLFACTSPKNIEALFLDQGICEGMLQKVHLCLCNQKVKRITAADLPPAIFVEDNETTDDPGFLRTLPGIILSQHLSTSSADSVCC